MSTADEKFLAPKQTARLLGISASTTYRLIAEGKIPSVRVGSQLRVPRVALVRKLGATRRG